METTESLTEQKWETVYALAKMLANEETDINELGKIIAYLRAYGNQEKAGIRFFEYLKNLVRNGGSIGHSKKTIEYYTTIEEACKKHLQIYQDDVPSMLQILGWVTRLMRYYKSGGSVAEMVEMAGTSTESLTPSRQAEIAKVLQSQNFGIGQILEATVTNIQSNKVTYEILSKIKLTQKEPKFYQQLSVKQKVNVKITDIKEDGSIKKIQLLS